MKQIEISDELYEQLAGISKQMNTQDHRATRMPYIFRIAYQKYEPCADGHGDKEIFQHFDGYEPIELKYEESEFRSEIASRFDIDDLPEGFDEMNEYELSEFLEKEGYTKFSVRKVTEYRGYFLTEKAAKDHLIANLHHYPDDAYTYLDHCWRSDDMEVVSRFLCELTGGEIHK